MLLEGSRIAGSFCPSHCLEFIVSESAGIPEGKTVTSLNGLNVLLVEDTWIIAQSYAGLLDPLGVNVLGPASNIAEATRILGESRIDVALVDINLQGELAYDLIESISRRGIPIVVVTGYEVLPRLGDRAHAVLKKPIRAEQLLRVLRKIAAARQAGVSAVAPTCCS